MLGNRLKMLREETGLSQNELSQKINVSASAIGMYETNKREPNIDVLLKFANFFGVSMDFLVGKTDKRNLTINEELIKIGLSTEKYTKPTPNQVEQIKNFVEFVLKDNKKGE